MFKCANGGHAMSEGQKFCGECGSKPAEATGDGACGSCSASMLKAAKFCSDCGTAAVAPGEELDAAIGELEEFQKARLALTADLAELPEVHVDDLDVEPADMLKANIGADGQPTGDYDVLPVIDAMLKGQALTGRQSRAYAEHIVRALGAIADGQSLLVKANIALAGRVRALDEKLEHAGTQSRGRVAVAGMTLVDKGVAGRTAPGGAPAAGRTDIRGNDLMAKCLVLGPDEGGLNSEEISTLEHYTNGGGGVPEMLRDKRTALANRVTQTLERVTARQVSAH